MITSEWIPQGKTIETRIVLEQDETHPYPKQAYYTREESRELDENGKPIKQAQFMGHYDMTIEQAFEDFMTRLNIIRGM